MRIDDINDIRKCVVDYMSKNNIRIRNPNPSPDTHALQTVSEDNTRVTYYIRELSLKVKHFTVCRAFWIQDAKRYESARVEWEWVRCNFSDQDGLEKILRFIFQIPQRAESDIQNLKVILDNISEEQTELADRVLIALTFQKEDIPTYVNQITEHFRKIASARMNATLSVEARIGRLEVALDWNENHRGGSQVALKKLQESRDIKIKNAMDNISEEQKELVNRVVMALRRARMFRTEHIPTYVNEITEHFRNIVRARMIAMVADRVVATLESRSI